MESISVGGREEKGREGSGMLGNSFFYDFGGFRRAVLESRGLIVC